ncbi:MAG: hypothetical protein F4Z77_11820 [Dehalococcoidia bacterium]|nr:hypothetical protein [Dehalococcoidia bacterium]MYA52552.1 hypothetical protein [Dehalococcoidia bacterium]
MTNPEIAVAVLLGLALLLQGFAGWLAFVAYYNENLVRAGNKESSYEFNGSLIAQLAYPWGKEDGRERWAFRVTRKWFGSESAPSTPPGDANLPYRNGGCWIGARAFRFISFGFAGLALYVGFIFDVAVVRLLG